MQNEAKEPQANDAVSGQVGLLVMPEFSQDVCENGAAILMDGRPLTIEQILELLRKGEEAKRVVGEMWDMFYGQNLHVVGWHLNGDHQSIDTFFESNDWNIDEA